MAGKQAGWVIAASVTVVVLLGMDIGARADTIYLTCGGNNLVERYSTATGDLGPYINCSGLGEPAGVAVDSSGAVYVSDYFSSIIWRYTPGGGLTKFADTGAEYQGGLAFDQAGNLYASAYYSGVDSKISPAGSVSRFSSAMARSMVFDATGNLYTIKSGNQIVKVAPDGTSSVFIGSGLNSPAALAFDAQGDLYVADGGKGYGPWIGKFSANGTLLSVFVHSSFGNGLDNPMGMVFDSAGNLYVANGNGIAGTYNAGGIEKYDPNGTASIFAPFGPGADYPMGIAIETPEPATMGLLAVGLAALAARRKRAGK